MLLFFPDYENFANSRGSAVMNILAGGQTVIIYMGNSTVTIWENANVSTA